VHSRVRTATPHPEVLNEERAMGKDELNLSNSKMPLHDLEENNTNATTISLLPSVYVCSSEQGLAHSNIDEVQRHIQPLDVHRSTRKIAHQRAWARSAAPERISNSEKNVVSGQDHALTWSKPYLPSPQKRFRATTGNPKKRLRDIQLALTKTTKGLNKMYSGRAENYHGAVRPIPIMRKKPFQLP
jgi:hypothetical protein